MELKETLDINNYVEQINKAEAMLGEIKRGLFLLDKNFQESIKRGERDIVERRITVCKTEEELDDFFESI